MAILTSNLVTYLDFLDPACFTNGGRIFGEGLNG